MFWKKTILFSIIFGALMVCYSWLTPDVYNYHHDGSNFWFDILSKSPVASFSLWSYFFERPIYFIESIFKIQAFNLFYSEGLCLSPWKPSIIGYIAIFAIYFIFGLLISSLALIVKEKYYLLIIKNRKRIFKVFLYVLLILVIILAIITLVFFAYRYYYAVKIQDISTWQTYENKKYNFEFKYPKSLFVDSEHSWEKNVNFNHAKGFNPYPSFYNISIFIDDPIVDVYGKTVSLDEYLKKYNYGYYEIRNEKIINGLRWLVFIQQKNDRIGELGSMRYLYAKDDIKYEFVFNGDSNSFQEKIFERMITTFRFVK